MTETLACFGPLVTCVVVVRLFVVMLNLESAGYRPYLAPSLCDEYLVSAVTYRHKMKRVFGSSWTPALVTPCSGIDSKGNPWTA